MRDPDGFDNAGRWQGAVSAYRPPLLTKSAADLGHAIGMMRQPAQWLLAGESITASPAPAAGLIDRDERWVTISTLTDDLRLMLPDHAFQLVLERLLPGEDIAGVADDVKLAVFEEAIEPLLLELESAIIRSAHFATLTVSDTAMARAGHGMVGAIISGSSSGPLPVLLELPESDTARLIALLERVFPRQTGATPLSVRASLRFGSTVLSLEDLMSLQSGDAVMLDHYLLNERKAALIIEEYLAAPCVIDGDLRLLTEPLTPARGGRLAGWCGPLDQPTQPEEQGRGVVLPMRLDFDGWSGFFDVLDLGALSVGQQLPVVREIDTRVQIKLNGHIIGAGEIMQLSDRFAARVDYLKVGR